MGTSSVMRIYLDHNATTFIDPEVARIVADEWQAGRGNPASRHHAGREARVAIDRARRAIARDLDAGDADLVWTSGATEANQLALAGLAGPAGNLLATSAIEHASVLEPLRRLEPRGYRLLLLPVDRQGRIVLDSMLDEDLSPHLLSIQLANSETGVIQDIGTIRQRFPDAILHIDATQAVGRIPVSFRSLGADALTFSGHKIHGPPGMGCLILRKGLRPEPLLLGGSQQQGLRAGTEPVALIVGLAKAVELAVTIGLDAMPFVATLRDQLEAKLQERVGKVVVHGPPAPRLPNTSSLSILGTRSEALLMALDLAQIAASAGSACASGSIEPSHVLRAMGVPPEELHSAVRFSLARLTTEQETDEASIRIQEVVDRLRGLVGQTR